MAAQLPQTDAKSSVVHCSLGYGVTNSDYVIDSGSGGNNNSLLTLHSPSTFPGSDTMWSNVDNNSLLNDKSLFMGVGYIRHYHFK